jgi:predicted TIM-barrel fold metal-dependent hydrolase
MHGVTPSQQASDGDALLIADPHQHFWNLERLYYPWLHDETPIAFRYGDYSSLRSTYLPPHYRRDHGALRVVKTVHVEAECDRTNPTAETRWLETLAAEFGLPTACVAHAALDDDGVEDVLSSHAESRLVRGIRHKPAAVLRASDARRGLKSSMDDPAWRRGYALLARWGWSFDLQTPWWHLPAAADLAADFPSIPIIINHAALPADRSEEGLAYWRSALACVAAYPNVALKISGLGQEGQPWTLQSNRQIIVDAVSIFGVDRCMFASNFPVDRLVAPLSTIFDGFRAAVSDRPALDRRKLFHDNAVRLYRLS